MNENKIIFLLGGHDLEMVEIISMLKGEGFVDGVKLPENHLLYFDNNLVWGAKWSNYDTVLRDQKYSSYIIYGIELTKDIELPPNCKIIDHHNELPAEPTSIEQIATILEVTLDRKQLLVAANDHGYKPAMRAAGATEQEIQEIRMLDREAQGVTAEEEKIAAQSITDARSINEVTIIFTTLTKFSPIVDRLDADKLIVYNSNALCYYGIGAKKLGEKYLHNLVEAKKAYYGGGENGFFGVVANSFTETELNNQVIPVIIKHN